MDALWPNASIGCGLNQDQGQYTVQIVTGIKVTIGNCFPEVGETLPDAEGRG